MMTGSIRQCGAGLGLPYLSPAPPCGPSSHAACSPGPRCDHPLCHPVSQSECCRAHRRGDHTPSSMRRHRGRGEGFCTACTRGLKTHTLLFGKGTCLVWYIYALESRLQREKLPNMATPYLIRRHLVPGWVACTHAVQKPLDRRVGWSESTIGVARLRPSRAAPAACRRASDLSRATLPQQGSAQGAPPSGECLS